MTERIDFSRKAQVYDRLHGAFLPSDILQALTKVARLRSGARVLDIGAGTGRVAMALAERGCQVVALEPTQRMLDSLRKKTRGLPVTGVRGEGGWLPFTSGCFHSVVLSRVMYLMRDWRDVLHEAVRVLKVGGSILHEWGNGSGDEEWVQIREKARSLFEQAGVKEPFHPGARSEEDVNEGLIAEGFSEESEVRAAVDSHVKVGEFLRRIVEGEYTYTWNVSSDIQAVCLPELQRWTAEQFGLDRLVPFPREITWKVFQRR